MDKTLSSSGTKMQNRILGAICGTSQVRINYDIFQQTQNITEKHRKTNRPDLAVLDKQKNLYIIYISILRYRNTETLELEKRTKYKELARLSKSVRKKINTILIIPIAISVDGIVSNNFSKKLRAIF